jgi:hypothetical protein
MLFTVTSNSGLYSPPNGFLRIEISTATTESGHGLGFVYNISFLGEESSKSTLITIVYLYVSEQGQKAANHIIFIF